MSSIKLEVGKKYRTRRGEVVGPLTYDSETTSPYVFDGKGETAEYSWTIQGKYWESGEHNRNDIVEEVVDPLDAMLDAMEAAAQAEQKASDPVNHPEHYTAGAIECIDAIAAAMTPEEFRGYLRGNAFKYLWRYRMKGGVESLQKAQWYLDRLTKAVA